MVNYGVVWAIVGAMVVCRTQVVQHEGCKTLAVNGFKFDHISGLTLVVDANTNEVVGGCGTVNGRNV